MRSQGRWRLCLGTSCKWPIMSNSPTSSEKTYRGTDPLMESYSQPFEVGLGLRPNGYDALGVTAHLGLLRRHQDRRG